MPHLSFRSTLFITVLLIAGALGAAAGSGWMMLQDFALASRQAGVSALKLSAAMQQIDERSADMERSARQYAVLQAPALRERFDEAYEQAQTALVDIEAELPVSAATTQWLERAGRLAAGFEQTVPPTDAVDAESDLASVNDRLAAAVRSHIDQRNTTLLDTLERSRDRLALQMLAAVVLAMLLALAIGWWILRPLKHVERAITRLAKAVLRYRWRSAGQPICVNWATGWNGCASAWLSSKRTAIGCCAMFRTN